ncbi:MAG: ABC transporter substrate-binding protein [Methanomicrobiaceae archaeon]|nr:ABC transporter substrate-binding protein [Methanomicrobiaceae archaeon]
MNRVQGMFIAAILLAALALVSGCISSEPSGEETLTELRIGYQPSTHQMAHMTAFEKGWWQEDLAPFGVQRVTDREFPTGAPEMSAMIAGEIDIAYVGAAPFVAAVANSNLDAKIIAGAQTQGSDLVVRPDIEYSTPGDLRGLTIATFPPGTIQDTLLRNWLLENGLEPDVDVTIRGMGPGDAVTAITAGQIDAVFLPHPSPTIISEGGNGRTVVQSGEMAPNHACCVVVARGDLIQNHPDVVEQIVRTHIRATEYNDENTDEAIAIYAAKIGQDIGVVTTSLDEWDGTWISDPSIIEDSVVDYTQVQYELGYIEQPLTAEDLLDTSFYDRVSA